MRGVRLLTVEEMSEEAAGLLATTRYVGAEVEVDVEERVERMAAGFGEGPARSPEAGARNRRARPGGA